MDVDDDEENVEALGERERFQLDLEFVQTLANPDYLQFLAHKGYFEDIAFIRYLKYLLYWKQPQYAVYVLYPIALQALDLLQDDRFRQQLKRPAFVEDVLKDEIRKHHRYERIIGVKKKMEEADAMKEATTTTTTTTTTTSGD